MEGDAFASLATLRLPSPCRLLSSACCPDKDLIVLISRLGGHDKLSLWKLQGSKKWEVDVGEVDDASPTVAALVWSPNGEFPSSFLFSLYFHVCKSCRSNNSSSSRLRTHHSSFRSRWARRTLPVHTFPPRCSSNDSNHCWYLVVHWSPRSRQRRHPRHIQAEWGKS